MEVFIIYGLHSTLADSRRGRLVNLVPWMSFNLRKLKFIVVGIHAPYFFSGWSSQDLLKYKIKAEIEEKNRKAATLKSNLIKRNKGTRY